jgi:hypothetical protein
MAVLRDATGLPAGQPRQPPSVIPVVTGLSGVGVGCGGNHLEPAMGLRLIGLGLVRYAARGWFVEEAWRQAHRRAWVCLSSHQVDHGGATYDGKRAAVVACALDPEPGAGRYRVDGLLRTRDEHWYRYCARFDRQRVHEEGVVPLGTDEAKNLLRLSEPGLHARLFGDQQPGATE